MFDRTASGSSLRWFSIADEFTRECLALKVDRSIRSEDVIDTLAELFSSRGAPQCIRSDSGPEFVSRAIQRWLSQLKINSLYIEPGAPWENGYVESFNGTLWDQLLNGEIFDTLLEAKVLIERWRREYNTIRPHSSLGYLPPAPGRNMLLDSGSSYGIS
ncbi:MAG: hypothetical protein CME32_22715 [Gimesia sp.]|nr:hypothetical protein [Gimesia sp.]